MISSKEWRWFTAKNEDDLQSIRYDSSRFMESQKTFTLKKSLNKILNKKKEETDIGNEKPITNWENGELRNFANDLNYDRDEINEWIKMDSDEAGYQILIDDEIV